MSLMRMNRIKPASDPRMPSKIAAITRPIYGEKGDEFLLYLRQFGHITYAANMTGLTRRTFYDRRAKHPDFAEAWEEALAAFEEELTMRVVQTALEMGTGKWVQCFNPETGEPELDDDFEPVYRFETASVDPRVLNKLLSLRMSSVDGPAQTNVQINNSTTVQNALPSKPKLVQPKGAIRSSTVAKAVSGDRHDTIDAEVVQGTPQKPGEHLMPNHTSQISFVRPGGVATQIFADGAETMRICLGYLHDPDDGVLAEMSAKHDPVPWQSAKVRDEATWAVETRGDLDEETRARLLEWIAATPFFEDA